jgi:hypothetical protein
MVTLQVPGDPLGAKMLGRSQMEDLLDILR